MKPHIFMLDNVDSFTYNLVDELRALNYRLTIYRNQLCADYIQQQMQQAKSKGEQVLLLLSPGPGCPAEAGCMPNLLKNIAGRFPVLGICLGHQAIAEHYGANVVRANNVMHGKTSLMHHQHPQIFNGLPQPLPIARYHSLVAEQLPDSLHSIAETDGLTMAALHTKDLMLGFQFHPESILTTLGSQLLKQSIDFLLNPQYTGSTT